MLNFKTPLTTKQKNPIISYKWRNFSPKIGGKKIKIRFRFLRQKKKGSGMDH